MSHAIKVATYNIRKAVGLDQRRDPARILSVLNEIDADIVTLQEVDRRFGARVSALPLAMLEAETPYVPVPLNFRPAAIGWHGNAILLRKGIDPPCRAYRYAHIGAARRGNGRAFGERASVARDWRASRFIRPMAA